MPVLAGLPIPFVRVCQRIYFIDALRPAAQSQAITEDLCSSSSSLSILPGLDSRAVTIIGRCAVASSHRPRACLLSEGHELIVLPV